MSNFTTEDILSSKKHYTHVLIIDDSEVDLDVYTRFIRKDEEWQFRVSATMEKDEFFEFLVNETIDLALIDYSMPEIDGLTLIQEMKNRLQNRFDEICIIMMTGQGNEKIAVEAMKKGASDYISKQLITANFLQKTIKDSLYKFYLSRELSRAKVQLERNLILNISLKIRESLDLNAIIQTAVEEIRDYLKCDRVFIYRLTPTPKILGESVDEVFPQALNWEQESLMIPEYPLGKLQTWSCLEENLPLAYHEQLQKLQVRSRISIPLTIASVSDSPWGLLIADFCDRIHTWQSSEMGLLEEIGVQLSIGIQQSLLLEELRIQRDLATQSEKAKSVFLANMSHEIRTPMTAILGASELLVKYDLEPNAQYFLKIIQSSGQHLLTLINDILDLSKLESGFVPLDHTEFYLRIFLKEILDIFQILLFRKQLTIALDIAEDLPDCYIGDSARLRQIIYNLVANAIKFTNQGEISILVKSLPPIQPLTPNKISLYFEITDRGIGIELADQNKLFNPFFQVEDSTVRNFQGSGLGLAICKRLVELMGGQIGVNSQIGKGSTFWFTVNLDTKSTHHSAVQSTVKNLSETSSTSIKQSANLSHLLSLKCSIEDFKILLAEDNKINQELIRLMINRIGCQCDLANNGQIVMEMLNQKPYDIILMDCQMPVLDGYQTTQMIRQQNTFQDLVIIGLTAYAMEDDRDKCLNAGMNDYLAKPCTFAGLQEIIYKWIILSNPGQSGTDNHENLHSNNN